MTAMQCHLVHLTGPLAGEAKTYSLARISIGRSSSCDFQFDPYEYLMVSSTHAEILLDEGTYSIHDLNTRGGTYVNGQRITQRHPLRHEDYLQFGKHGPELIFRKGPAKAGLQPLPPEPPETGELELLSGSDAGKIFAVSGDQITRIGRRADLEVSLDAKGDMVVSGNHCTISYEDEEFILTDTSRNGTFINDQPVEGRAYIGDGDIIMLGENGPRARFRIHPPKRVFPNLTGAFPRLSHEAVDSRVSLEAADKRAAEMKEAEERAAANRQAMEKAAAAEKSDAPAERADEATGGQSAESQPVPDEDITAPVPVGSEPDLRAATEADAPAYQAPLKANVLRNSRPGINKQGLLWWGVSIFMMSLFVFSVYRLLTTREKGEEKRIDIEDYAAEIRRAQERRSAEGNYLVSVPENWNHLANGPFFSMESPDRNLSVDYARDNRVSRQALENLLSRGGAAVLPLSPKKRQDATAVTGLVARAETRSRIGVLLEPWGDVPAMAVLEGPNEIIGKLDDQTLASLLVDNFKLQRLAPQATATPAPAASPVPVADVTPAATPTAVAQVTPTASPTQAPTAQPAQTFAPVKTPQATGTAIPAPTSTAMITPTPDTRKEVVNSAARLTLKIPNGWTAETNEEEGVILVSGSRGVQIRITRDATKLDAEEIYSAMKGDGWQFTSTGTQSNPLHVGSMHGAEMKKGSEILRLILVEVDDGSTVITYATRPGTFSVEEITAVNQIVAQIARQ